MAAVSTNGHTNMEGVNMKGQEELSEEDGYFTCAVSVQHKVGISRSWQKASVLAN